jgi:hypothetical protein
VREGRGRWLLGPKGAGQTFEPSSLAQRFIRFYEKVIKVKADVAALLIFSLL